MKKLVLSFILFLAIHVGASAQAYTFSQTTTPYTDLVSPTVLTGNVIWDDSTFTVPLGFNFSYGGITYTDVDIDANGALVFISGFNFAAIVPLDVDLVDRGITAASSPISYQLSGTPGSRIFKVQWKNAGFYDGTATDFANIQTWIYEGSNRIETRFGASAVSNPVTVFGSAGGPASGIATSINAATGTITGIFLTGAPAIATAVVLTNSNTYPALSGMPTNGTMYLYSRGNLGVAEYLNNVKVSVYPNPVAEVLHIEGLTASKDKVTINVYDVLGKVVLTYESSAGTVIPVNVSGLTKGTYFVEISSGSERAGRQVIKL